MPALLFFSAAAAAFLQSRCYRYRSFAFLLPLPLFTVSLPPLQLLLRFPCPALSLFYGFPAAAAAFLWFPCRRSYFFAVFLLLMPLLRFPCRCSCFCCFTASAVAFLFL